MLFQARPTLVSLYNSLGCHGTHFVNLAGLELLRSTCLCFPRILSLFFFFKKILLKLTLIFAYVYMCDCVMCTCPVKSRRGRWISGAGVTDIVSCPLWVLGLQLESSEQNILENTTLLSSKPSFLLQSPLFRCVNFQG